MVFNQSRLPDLDELFLTCARISYKLHISQIELDNMEYWEYNNLVVYLTKIIEEENKAQNGENPYSNNMKDMQRNMKMPKFSAPKISSPKF